MKYLLISFLFISALQAKTITDPTCKLSVIQKQDRYFKFEKNPREWLTKKLRKLGYTPTFYKWRQKTPESDLLLNLEYNRAKSDLIIRRFGRKFRTTLCKVRLVLDAPRGNLLRRLGKHRALTTQGGFVKCKRAEKKVISKLPKCRKR